MLRRAAAVAAMLCICSLGDALQMQTAQFRPTALPRAPAPLLAVRRDAGAVADGAMASKIRSRNTFEERQHWEEGNHWLPRGDVQLPIDNELLYERLRAVSNRTTPLRPLSKRQVGVTTIRWLSRRTETCAQEYLDFYEGIASAQRFLQRRSAAAAAAAADAADADAGAADAAADAAAEAMRASVASSFSPTAVQQRVDEALGPTPEVAELERLGISAQEIAELSHAPLARRHLPTIWWLFRMGVRRALRARSVALTGSRRGWSESPAWALLCEMQRDAPEMQAQVQRRVRRPLREAAERPADAEEMQPDMQGDEDEMQQEMQGDAAERQPAATPVAPGAFAASTPPRAPAPLLSAAPGLGQACEVRLPPCAYTVKVQNLGWRGRAELGEDPKMWYDSEGDPHPNPNPNPHPHPHPHPYRSPLPLTAHRSPLTFHPHPHPYPHPNPKPNQEASRAGRRLCFR